MTACHYGNEFDIKMDESIQSPSTSVENPIKLWTIHVEVRVHPKATARFDAIRNHVYSYLISAFDQITCPSVLEGWEDHPVLAASVEWMAACESPGPLQTIAVQDVLFRIHLYQLSDAEVYDEFSNGFGADGESTMAASMCELPNRSLEGLWDSLIFAGNIKMRLLDYIHATLILSDANVDLNMVSWNRVVLLHGPPGTGKTSLCRALAQKVSIRLSHRFARTRLLEINSHSLFSKWFSESGKLVQRLFTNITELVEEEGTFVVVLIDEVESLTAARAGALAGSEPSDGLRVVNALLTQLDKLKHHKNVLIMSTSNLPKAIDSAFIDRADIVQYVDLPPCEAIYDILRTCLCEMIDKGVVKQARVPSLKEAQVIKGGGPNLQHPSHDPLIGEKSRIIAIKLLAFAALCKDQGMSGRALRRLPVLALARHIGNGLETSARVAFDERATSRLSADGVKQVGNSSQSLNTAERGRLNQTSRVGGADVLEWLEGMKMVLQDSTVEVQRLL